MAGLWHRETISGGEASFSTHGIIKDGYSVPTTFTSKIVSDAETSDVRMVLDEGNVKELAAAVPPPKSDRVPVTQTNRQGIVDPLTAMLFSAAAGGQGLSPDVCRHTLLIFDGQQRYDLAAWPLAAMPVIGSSTFGGPMLSRALPLRGFGDIVLTEIVPASLRGTALLEFEPEGSQVGASHPVQ